MQRHMTVTRVGLQIPSFKYPDVPDSELFERITAIATTAEESGFDSVWVMDHLHQIGVVGPETDPMLEGYTLLAGLAARTRRVGLGTMVTGVTYRNPALLAKIVTTLDVISAGRAILGIGAAWNEGEHLAYGADFGRDPAEITKTKVATLVVGRTVEEARAAVEVASGNRGDMAAAFVASAVVGDADAVVEQVAAHREAGLDGLIFNLPELRHLDQVRLAGEAVTKAFA